MWGYDSIGYELCISYGFLDSWMLGSAPQMAAGCRWSSGPVAEAKLQLHSSGVCREDGATAGEGGSMDLCF